MAKTKATNVIWIGTPNEVPNPQHYKVQDLKDVIQQSTATPKRGGYYEGKEQDPNSPSSTLKKYIYFVAVDSYNLPILGTGITVAQPCPDFCEGDTLNNVLPIETSNTIEYFLNAKN